MTTPTPFEFITETHKNFIRLFHRLYFLNNDLDSCYLIRHSSFLANCSFDSKISLRHQELVIGDKTGNMYRFYQKDEENNQTVLTNYAVIHYPSDEKTLYNSNLRIPIYESIKPLNNYTDEYSFTLSVGDFYLDHKMTEFKRFINIFKNKEFLEQTLPISSVKTPRIKI